MRSLAPLTWLAAVAVAAVVSPATAQQPISGNYVPGAFTGMKGAAQPPSNTVVLENGTLLYNTREFVDSSGNRLQTGETNIAANRTIAGYVTDIQILGGDWFPAVIIPFGNAPLRPVPGSRKEFQFGDLILQPVSLGWHWDQWHAQASYNLFMPTGRFNAGASNNVGKGLFSHLFTGGVTWIEEDDTPWAATLMMRYEFMMEQKDTNINPGQVLTIEGGVGNEIFKGIDLGATGYFVTQTTRERGSAPGTDTSRYRAFGIGPELTWRPDFLPGAQISARSYFEFGARNTSEGIFSVISLGYVF